MHRHAGPAAAVLLLVAALVVLRGPLGGPDPGVVTVPVERGPFRVRVIGTAQLDALQSVTVASALTSNAGKLVWLVPEGSLVSQGDLVARFDSAPFELELRKLERELNDARAQLAQTEAELRLQQQVGEEALASSELAVTLAGLRLASLQNADAPLRLAQAQHEVSAAMATLLRARSERDAQQEMFDGGFGSHALLADAAASEAEAGNRVVMARQALELLDRVSLPAEVEQAGLELQSRQREREHQLQAQLQTLARQNAVVLRARSTVDALQFAVSSAATQLEHTELRAPVPGFVVYKRIPVNGEQRKAQVGDSLWQGLGFMVIPDMSALVATMNVPEQALGRIAPGQPVSLQPDAWPELELNGSVEAVGMLAAEPGSGPTGETGNEFQLRIRINTVDPRLRPGMRARAQILVADIDDALRIPVEALYYDAGVPVGWVWRRGAPRRQPLRLGESDGSWVVVHEGVAAGERLLLGWPGAGS